MKLLLIVRWPVGGIRTYINYIYADWGQEPLEIDMVLPDIPESDLILKDIPGLVVHRHKTQSDNPGLVELALTAHSITKRKRFDLIHAHGFTSAVSIAWKLPFLGTPSALTSHDVLNRQQFEGIRGAVKALFLPLMFNRFSKIQSVSEDAQANLKATLPHIKQSKCTVIQNGIDTQRFHQAAKHDLRSELDIDPNVVILGFFGRFMSQKGFRYLVEAMETLENSHPGEYRVVCFGGGGFIREEKAELERCNLEHLFYFYHFVPNTASYMKACDIVTMPSLWEACGLVAMEALAGGTPLVASSCIGLREVCSDTPAIMVKPRDTQSLIDGIQRARETPRQVFEDFAAHARARFDIAETRAEVKHLYQNLVKADEH